jgi:uncharacterized protein (TIGR03086 family)
MDSDAVFLTGLDVFGRVVREVPADGWDAPSPCAGWTALDVLGHVVRILDVGNQILSGEPPDWSTPEGRPADLVGDDPVRRWEEGAARARTAMEGVDLEQVVESPMGPRSIREGLAFPGLDLHLHAWDLGRAVGVDVEIAPEVADFTHERIDPLPEEMKRSAGVFGPEVQAPADATPTEQLMAWTGRQVR